MKTFGWELQIRLTIKPPFLRVKIVRVIQVSTHSTDTFDGGSINVKYE